MAVSYTLVDSSNIAYMPRQNVVALLQSQLTIPKTDIRNSFPDLTQLTGISYPFIVIPDNGLQLLPGQTEGNNQQYDCVINGTVYHRNDQLSDDKFRRTRGDLVRIFTLGTNRSTLARYGIRGSSIELEPMDPFPTLHDKLALVECSFTITFIMDINMSARTP